MLTPHFNFPLHGGRVNTQSLQQSLALAILTLLVLASPYTLRNLLRYIRKLMAEEI